MTARLRKSLQTQKKQTKQHVPPIAGSIGIKLGGQTLTEVPNRRSFLYVRLRDNPNEVIQAFNNKVSPSYNLPVLMEWQNGRYVILSVDTVRYQNNWPTQAPYLPRHGNTHSFDTENGGGGDIVWVQSRQFMPALVIPSGSLGGPNVLMSSYNLRNIDGTWKYVGNTGTQSLLPYIPPNGSQAAMVLVYLDSISGNPYILVNSGSYFANTITGSAQITPYIPTLTDPNAIPLSAVRLVSGTAAIGWNSIYDARQFLHIMPTGSSGGGISDAPVDGNLYGRKNAGWTIITGSSGGSITGSADATYLRLDTTNDPLTGQLQIVPSAAGVGGLYIETKGNDYAADIEQYVYNSGTVTSPTLFLYRAPGDATHGTFSSASHMIEAWQDRNGGTIAGKFILFHSDGTDRFYVNPSAQGTGTNVFIDGDFNLSNDANLLLLENNGSPRTKIAAQGNIEFGLNSLPGKEANAGKIGYQTFTSGFLDIVGAGTTAGQRWVLVYDKLKVSDHFQTNSAQTLGLLSTWVYANATGTLSSVTSAPDISSTVTGSSYFLGTDPSNVSGKMTVASTISYIKAVTSQVVQGASGPNNIAAGQTRYFGIYYMDATESLAYVPMGKTVTVRNLRVWSQGSPGVGQTYTCTLRNTLAATSLTCTITAGNNSASDTTHSTIFSSTDRWALEVVASASAATTNIVFSFEIFSL